MQEQSIILEAQVESCKNAICQLKTKRMDKLKYLTAGDGRSIEIRDLESKIAEILEEDKRSVSHKGRYIDSAVIHNNMQRFIVADLRKSLSELKLNVSTQLEALKSSVAKELDNDEELGLRREMVRLKMGVISDSVLVAMI